MSSDLYVEEAIKNVEKRLKEDGLKYNKNIYDLNYSTNNPFSSVDYRPELDTFMECTEYQASFYQNLIGVIRYAIELLHIDTLFEVSELSIHLGFPRTEHLMQDLHVFKYLEIHNANDEAFDPCYQRVTSHKNIQSKVQAMKDLYIDAGAEISPYSLKPGVDDFLAR